MKALLLTVLITSMPIHMYNSTDLTQEILASREGSVIIERCVGICEEPSSGGRILGKENQNYISYSKVEGVQPGDKVLSYFVYNPNTNYVDDIIYRTDFIID